MKKICVLFLNSILAIISLCSCHFNEKNSGQYDFVIYEKDEDNFDLSNNKIVKVFHIKYTNCSTVIDTLIEKDGKYYFSSESNDYLILEKGVYGFSYKYGYFENYFACEDENIIDVSWSYTSFNGNQCQYGIGETPVANLKEYGFVINGWKN